MKIVFEKLKTSNENVYVDFGDGTWQPFPVNEAKNNGIIIPNTCNDYSKIKIKGKADVLPNLDVITGIKRYEEVGADDIIVQGTIDMESSRIISSIGGVEFSSFQDLYANGYNVNDIGNIVSTDSLSNMYYVSYGSGEIVVGDEYDNDPELRDVLDGIGSVYQYDSSGAASGVYCETVEIDGYNLSVYKDAEDVIKSMLDNSYLYIDGQQTNFKLSL